MRVHRACVPCRACTQLYRGVSREDTAATAAPPCFGLSFCHAARISVVWHTSAYIMCCHFRVCITIMQCPGIIDALHLSPCITLQRIAARVTSCGWQSAVHVPPVQQVCRASQEQRRMPNNTSRASLELGFLSLSLLLLLGLADFALDVDERHPNHGHSNYGEEHTARHAHSHRHIRVVHCAHCL